MGGLSCGRAFAADAVGAMHDKWFFRRDRELDGNVALRCLEDLRVRSGRWRFGAPPIDPDVEPITAPHRPYPNRPGSFCPHSETGPC